MELGIKIPIISIAEESIPIVKQLLDVAQKQSDVIQVLKKNIQELKDEIARIKKHKTKPKIKPSTLETKLKTQDPKKRPGSAKGSKKGIQIHKTIRIKPKEIPAGACFKGIREFDVQDIQIMPHNTRYEIEEWVDADGKAIAVTFPALTQHPHFGVELIAYILYQHHHCQVTQPLLLEQLKEWGVHISAGQISAILTSQEALSEFHHEKKEILINGIKVSPYLQTDDTGARHQGKNGYCTYLGNEFFAWFASTEKKSRINFLQLLQGNVNSQSGFIYVIDRMAIQYMKEEKLPIISLQKLRFFKQKIFETSFEWENQLKTLGITNERHIRIATEAALYAGCLVKGLRKDLIILSDDAGQFHVPLMQHALCWIHAERLLKKIIPISSAGIKDFEEVISDFWMLYENLKSYRSLPSKEARKNILMKFDRLFQRKTACSSLNQALKRLFKNKAELLLVLDYPEIPLHNNTSESDIREFVKRRKVSGSTRSIAGQKARDTFVSLKKTCRKLGISFWAYLKDRLSNATEIKQLSQLICIAVKNYHKQREYVAQVA